MAFSKSQSLCMVAVGIGLIILGLAFPSLVKFLFEPEYGNIRDSQGRVDVAKGHQQSLQQIKADRYADFSLLYLTPLCLILGGAAVVAGLVTFGITSKKD